jgi:hypothetical protein
VAAIDYSVHLFVARISILAKNRKPEVVSLVFATLPSLVVVYSLLPCNLDRAYRQFEPEVRHEKMPDYDGLIHLDRSRP